VIAAGERWERSSGSLRPSVEDLLGAGAILTRLATKRPTMRGVILHWTDEDYRAS
jgi:2-phosphosulfolactate phosphatase